MENSMYETYKIEGVRDFSADHIFDCGQCFRWNRESDGSYTGIAFGRAVNIKETDGTVTIENCTEEDYSSIWADYLDMKRDYGMIKESLSEGDSVMKAAAAYGSGIRLLQQDPWETLISFIISQNSNIPRIKKCIEALCENFGRGIGVYRGAQRFAFPTPERLAGLTREELAVCRLGYRDTYIIEAAKAVAADAGSALYSARGMSGADAERYIRSIKGVGPKVANCIMLFGLLKYESFPIDVWMKRIMHELYGFDQNDLRGMQAYAAEKFGEYSGFAQQYLFYYARENL